MTAPVDRAEVELMCGAAPFADNEAGIPEMVAMLRRLVDERDTYRAAESDILAERDALAFERNNLRAQLATARESALKLSAEMKSQAARWRRSASVGPPMSHLASWCANMAGQIQNIAKEHNT